MSRLTVRIVPEQEQEQARLEYATLRKRLGPPATAAQLQAFLAQRPTSSPDAELDPKVAMRLRKRLEKKTTQQ
jgi:hypothetical protein